MGLNSNRVEDLSCHENTVVRIPPEALMPSVEIHKVCLPPKQTTFQKFKQRLSEIFFPDDPLHGIHNQTSFLRKLYLGLQFFFPIFQWGPHYNVGLLRSDIISGLTIASLAIPQVKTQKNDDISQSFFSSHSESFTVTAFIDCFEDKRVWVGYCIYSISFGSFGSLSFSFSFLINTTHTLSLSICIYININAYVTHEFCSYAAVECYRILFHMLTFFRKLYYMMSQTHLYK